MDPSLSDIERLLSDSRPRPRADFVDDLEESLLRSVRPRRMPRLRFPSRRVPRLLAVASAGGLAALVLGLSLGDGVPQSIGGATDATANRTCTTTTELRWERRPSLTVDAKGRLGFAYRPEFVRQPVIRCR